jgi:hypothetical protein
MLSRRSLAAAGEDAKALMTAAAGDADTIRAASLASEAEVGLALLTPSRYFAVKIRVN